MSDGAGHVLVVDDNRLNRLKLARGLENQGYAVNTAENGREALEMLRSTSFELLLLDIMMPEVDGFQVLQEMKSDPELRDIPVIVISALEEMDSVVKCIEMGAEDHMPKPFDPTLLNARIGASLEKKRLRDEVVEQLKFIRDIFGKYVPESVAKQIVAGKGVLEPTQTTATILYTDIESFTSTAESVPPKQVVQMLNEYFPAVIEPITRYGGVVNQFQGDAMLVTFNIPIQDSQHADHAVNAALEIQKLLKGRTFAGIPLRTRIGINTGEVIAGNVGTGDRINYTVHGDAVNLAARLEQLNKKHGTLVLISESTVALLNGEHSIEPLGEVEIRGKTQSVRIFSLRTDL
ncbi:MAG: response regulator [Gammaproteobacteria bacterium]|nr:response regulator [Gammaproteobacteria bacterium]